MIPIDDIRTAWAECHTGHSEDHLKYMSFMAEWGPELIETAQKQERLSEDLEAGRVAIVPVEPTPEMFRECNLNGYRAAIAAAPPYEFGGVE